MRTGIENIVGSLLGSQSVGVLATYDGTVPYCSMVAFAGTEDLRSIVFATMRDTRKYANIKRTPEVSILIDSRTNRMEDFNDAMALTTIGSISEPAGGAKTEALSLFLSRHPYLRDFVLDPNCAILKMNVRKYVLVTHFKEVTELVVNR